jgi:hypothetical protein
VKTHGAVLFGVAGLLSGCVYYNAIYNAQRLFDQGERAHWSGRDSVAAERYEEVIRKAADGYRRQPDGPWADEALYLIGRAHFRRGRMRAARAALREAAADAGDTTARLDAICYLGATLVASGDVERGMPLLDEALRGLRSGPASAEGHLWRARAFLEQGRLERGWQDLDAVKRTDRRLRVAAGLERLRWGAHYGDHLQVREAAAGLLSEPEAGQRADSILTLMAAVAERWGAADAAQLLSGVGAAPGERTVRGEVRLARAHYLRAAGDTAMAADEARAVAAGIGSSAGSARILLARWRLARAQGLSETQHVVALLRPAAKDAAVARMLVDLKALSDLSAAGLDDPLGWFAAGEIARDRLGAPYLALGFFLAYADAAPHEPWAPKAILAALSVAPSEGTRAWLRGRLEGLAGSPYVRAARGEPAPGLESLDEELAERLKAVRAALPAADSAAVRGQPSEPGADPGG